MELGKLFQITNIPHKLELNALGVPCGTLWSKRCDGALLQVSTLGKHCELGLSQSSILKR